MSFYAKALVLLVALPISQTSSAGSMFYDVAKNKEVISDLSKASTEELPSTLTLLTWNIHKAEDQQDWASDFRHLAKNSDLVFVQEAVLNPLVQNTLTQLPGFNFTMATSFYLNNETSSATGVLTGARANPSERMFLRSPDTEPIANTPKMALLEKFNVAGHHDQLLVVNVHAINFTFNPAFKRQVTQIVKRIKQHQGPVILAGDFNTWHEGRREILEEAAASVGLEHLPPARNSRFLELDHIFVRGIRAVSVDLLDNIETSDHYPLTAKIEILPEVIDIKPVQVKPMAVNTYGISPAVGI